MRTHDGSPLQKRCHVDGQRPIKSFIRLDIQDRANHALARGSGEHRQSVFLQGFEPVQDYEILIDRLPEAESGIKDLFFPSEFQPCLPGSLKCRKNGRCR